MDAERAGSQRLNSALMLTITGFMLFVCEWDLFRWILAKASNHHGLWDYAALPMLAAPFLIGLVLRYRVSKMQPIGEVSPRAATKINSEVTLLIFITYCVLLFFSNYLPVSQ